MTEKRSSLTESTGTSDAASPPAPIVPRSVRRQLEDRPRRVISDGAYASGEHLSGRVPCEQLGVGRSLVREAVRPLEAEGL